MYASVSASVSLYLGAVDAYCVSTSTEYVPYVCGMNKRVLRGMRCSALPHNHMKRRLSIDAQGVVLCTIGQQKLHKWEVKP